MPSNEVVEYSWLSDVFRKKGQKVEGERHRKLCHLHGIPHCAFAVRVSPYKCSSSPYFDLGQRTESCCAHVQDPAGCDNLASYSNLPTIVLRMMDDRN